MKEFLLKEMMLLSQREKSALKILFGPKRTVIIGGNSTGKSCLVKSIYYTFGAEPHELHPNWVAANVTSLVKFTVDGIPYYIMREGKVFTLFDYVGDLIAQFTKISALGRTLADLFDFRIQLLDREGELVAPPPAYLFLPYYIDQDKSWTQNWASFNRLYLPNAKQDIVNYHTGIRSNDYYETKGVIRIADEQIKQIDSELKAVKSLLVSIKKKLSQSDFTIDIEAFQYEVEKLLIACEKLNKIQNDLKHKLSHLYNAKITLEAQLKITLRALQEVQGDYDYAVNALDEVVECPSCGAQYDNTFADRFGMAQDEQRCLDLANEIKNDLASVNKEIESSSPRLSENIRLIADIEKQLEVKKEKIKLRDLIESEGRREMKSLFESEIDVYNQQLRDLLLLKRQNEARIKSIDNKERKESIKSMYLGYMSSFLKKINIYSLPETSYNSISSSIKESGSAKPRALMAYYYSILHIVREFGSSAFCPIVIDAPNQQGQDSENLPIMLEFIKGNQPDKSQLILTIEESHSIDFDAKIIELTRKRKLLSIDDYASVLSELNPFLTKSANAVFN